jgi:acetyltransferase-like isoleucine patch superfamily enzyme
VSQPHPRTSYFRRLVSRLISEELRSDGSIVATDVRSMIAEEIGKHERSISIVTWDPLRRQADNAEEVARILEQSCNYVGSRVMVEDGAVLIGGKHPSGVGLRLGDQSRVYSGCHLVIDQIGPESGIVLGADVSLNYNCYIDGSGGVDIGRGTIIGPNSVILSSSHRIDQQLPVNASGKRFCAVSIGEDVWVGASTVLLPGRTIGDRAVIGAGSIVTHDVGPGSVVGGNPARPLNGPSQPQPP